MVRDFCVSKAEEEKFLHVVDGGHLPQGLMNERRISFNRADLNVIWGPTIRTILCFQLQNSSDCWLDFLQSSRLLKVLNGVGCNQKEGELPILSRVFELFHLTYLALIGSFNIPTQISDLVNLQTFIIHPNFRKSKRNLKDYSNASHFSLPLEIWKITQLRHVILYDLYMLPHPPDHVLPLENLQTLSHVENLVWSDKMVQMIPNVKKLGLVYALDQECHLQHLQHLHQLENLQVAGYQQFSWRGQNPSFPTTLKKLILVGGGFAWKDMSIIGLLPNLQVLKLRDHACDGETWEIGDEEFPELKYLGIDKSRLVQWEMESSSPFPKLQRLVLRSCESLREIPGSIGDITTLEYIEVCYCARSVVESAEQIREDQESYGNEALQVVVHSNELEVLALVQSPGRQMRILPEKAAKSGPMELISGDGEFKEADFNNFLKSAKLHDRGVVVAIMGPQISGKSTLLNSIFSTHFIEMNAESGRSQTTKGIWIEKAPHMEPLTTVLDLEGTDGVERGEDDTAFERQSALFALVIADVLIINMWCNEIGRERAANRPLLTAIFEAMMHLFSRPRTTLLFVIRDTPTKTPFELLETILRKDVQKIWETVRKPQGREDTHLSEFFNVEVTALSHYEYARDMFDYEVNQLRQRYIHTISPRQDASHISFWSANKLWDMIKQYKDLSFPPHRVMLATTVRCEEIAMEQLRLLKSNKAWLDLEEAAKTGLVPGFNAKISSILRVSMEKYDFESINFEEDVMKSKRQYLESEALKVVHPAYMNTLGHLRSTLLRSFETQLKALLSKGEGFAESVRTCRERCVHQFDLQCIDHAAIDANWDASIVRRQLLHDIENHAYN